MFLVISVYLNIKEHPPEVWHFAPGTPCISIAGDFLDAVQIFVSIIFLTKWTYFNFLIRVLVSWKF